MASTNLDGGRLDRDHSVLRLAHKELENGHIAKLIGVLVRPLFGDRAWTKCVGVRDHREACISGARESFSVLDRLLTSHAAKIFSALLWKVATSSSTSAISVVESAVAAFRSKYYCSCRRQNLRSQTDTGQSVQGR